MLPLPWYFARVRKHCRWTKLVLAAAAFCWACVPSVSAFAQATEAGVKAAYIYRFLEYVTWPAAAFETPQSPIVIGVAQDDDVAAELARIARERTMEKRRLQIVTGREDAATMHVLYVSRSAYPRAARWLSSVAQRPVLVVTEMPNGLERGAIINFVPVEGRIQFEVSVQAAQRAGLVISSRLLAVAVRIKKGEASHRVYAQRAPAPRKPTGRVLEFAAHGETLDRSRRRAVITPQA